MVVLKERHSLRLFRKEYQELKLTSLITTSKVFGFVTITADYSLLFVRKF